MRKIPLHRPIFDHRELEMVKKCIDSGWVTQGPLATEFERLFAERHKLPFALTTTSCTAALHLSTLAFGLGPGDEVICLAFTWVTSANCAEYVGAKVVFADIDLDTFNIDPAALRAAVTPNTKAVVAVHLFGLSANMDPILEIAAQHSLAVIEDAACAVGGDYKGRPIGGIGDIGCFSFHPRKIITTGEGGMVTMRDEKLAERVSSYRNHGSVVPPGGAGVAPCPYDMPDIPNLGFNLRMSDICASVGLAQLEKLDALIKERCHWAVRYDEAFSNSSDVITPSVPEGHGHTYQSYVVRIKDGGVKRRNFIMDEMAANNIWTRPGTHAVHNLAYYQERYGLCPEDFSNATRAENETITLPIFPNMEDDDFNYVVVCLENALKKIPA
jgi:dTDP-4-amino-4,6-dideoxygalactose transaminase